MKQNFILAVSLCCFLIQMSTAWGDDTAPVSFRSDIAPILLESCFACHGPKKAEGGYRVDTYDELLKAGDSGELPIAASPDQVSELLRRITCDDESERMPAESEALPPEQIELMKKWIAAGGKFDGENASQSLALVIPPVQYADPPEVYSQVIPITATIFSPDGKLSCHQRLSRVGDLEYRGRETRSADQERWATRFCPGVFSGWANPGRRLR